MVFDVTRERKRKRRGERETMRLKNEPRMTNQWQDQELPTMVDPIFTKQLLKDDEYNNGNNRNTKQTGRQTMDHSYPPTVPWPTVHPEFRKRDPEPILVGSRFWTKLVDCAIYAGKLKTTVRLGSYRYDVSHLCLLLRSLFENRPTFFGNKVWKICNCIGHTQPKSRSSHKKPTTTTTTPTTKSKQRLWNLQSV